MKAGLSQQPHRSQRPPVHGLGGHRASSRTYGVDEPAGCYDDLDHCDVLILWGNNPAEMHPVLFSRFIDRRSRGEKVTLIDIGTRRTRTSGVRRPRTWSSSRSPTWPSRTASAPAGRAATRYDKDFVAKHCAFRARGRASPTLNGEAMRLRRVSSSTSPKYTPEHVEQISGVPAAKLQLLGQPVRRQAKRRITSLWCMGMNQHTRGTAINHLVHGIHLLSGPLGQAGRRAAEPDRPAVSACGTAREVGTLSHAPARRPAGGQRRSTARRPRRSGTCPRGRINAEARLPHGARCGSSSARPTDQGGDIDTLWVQVTNPGQSLPNLQPAVRRRAASSPTSS